MIRRSLYMLAAGVATGAVVGALTATPPRAAAPQADAHTLAPVHGGAVAAKAAERLAAVSFAAPPPVEAPPPPDIAVTFRRDLTAIENTPTGAVVWVVDWNQASGRRAIHRGGEYRDGWRVSEIGNQTVELRKRTETRQVDVYAPPEDTPQ
ncbi:MAG: hypothetical protein ABL883_11515 [Terricaulis sp.]